MKTWEKILSAINIGIMLILIAGYFVDENIAAVCGWLIVMGWYLIALRLEAECRRIRKKLDDVYHEAT